MKILIIIILLEIILITMLLLVNKIYSLLKKKETFEKSDDNLSQKVNNARNENTKNDNYLKEKNINILNSDKAKIKKNIFKESEVQITLSDDSGNIFLNKNIKGNYRKIEIKNLHISSETSITTKTVKVKAEEIKVDFFS